MINLFRTTPQGDEVEALRRVINSKWWGQGSQVQEFEQQFAYMAGARYAVATNSCSTALDIAVKILDLGDEISVSPFTFVSSALAILHNDKKVKFVDIDPYSYCTPRADIQVLYAGNDFGVGKIYDMAHMGGEKHRGVISCWSFHAVKNIPTGDGGMITTNVKELADRARALAWCGIDKSTFERSQGKYSWDYNIEEVGWKANMSDIVAAIGLCQLKVVRERNKVRAQIARWYDTYLSYSIARPFKSTTWHMYTIQVPRRDELYDLLAECGIEAGVHYKPLYKYPMFPQEVLPNTEKVFQNIITLPMHIELTEEDVKKVCNVVNHHVEG